MASLALISGALLGGYLTWDLHGLLQASNLVRPASAIPRHGKSARWLRHAITLLVVLVGLSGAIAFYVNVYDPFPDPDSARIEGAVAVPYTYRVSEWSGDVVTINAELQGSITTIPPRDYQGPLLADIVGRAAPDDDASSLRIIAADGYEIELPWTDVKDDRRLLLAQEEGGLRLVAAAYDGTYWVQQVRRIVVR
jgi:hypothetical protein